MSKTAILVDGGFYRKRAAHLWGKKTAEERAKELSEKVSGRAYTESASMMAMKQS